MGLLIRPRNENWDAPLLRRYLAGSFGDGSWAGINVNTSNALQVAAVFGCVRVIAEDIGKLPFKVYQQSGSGERSEAKASPFWKLIHDKPNSYQTSQQFREYLTACALLRGNGYALKNIVGGQVRELLPIHPDRVTVEQGEDWELTYHVTLQTGKNQDMTRQQIFHLPGLTIDGPTGVSVISYARQTMGIALGANRHAGTFFANGMKPSGIFSHPGVLKPEAYERLKASLETSHSGTNSHKNLVIEEGMKYEPITLTNKDSQFLESRTFEVEEVCRWFRVPPHKVADLSRATFSNIEQMAMEYVTDTLMPWAKRWEYSVNQQAIALTNYFAEIAFDALLRGTTIERYEAYKLATGGTSWMAGNEVRKKENMEPIEGLDEILQPLNMGAAGTQSTEQEPQQ